MRSTARNLKSPDSSDNDLVLLLSFAIQEERQAPGMGKEIKLMKGM
jgi:hypothetical protein